MIRRHAKSSWATSGQEDFERPLNDRGHRDAPMMAKRLLEKQIQIDAFVSSTANRAFTTATYFAEAYHKTAADIQAVRKLYHAYEPVFSDVISQLADNIETIALFAHNPGITDFVNQLCSTKIDDMPTCGIFAVKLDLVNWKDFRSAKKAFWFFDYPKL